MVLIRNRALVAAAIGAAPVVWNAGAHGATFTWTGTNGTAWIGTAGSTNWNTGASNPASGDIALFTTPTTNQPALNQSSTVSGVSFTNTTGSWTLGGGGGNVLTVGSNLITATTLTSGTLSFGMVLQPSTNQQWSFGNSASTSYGINFTGGIDLNDTTLALKFLEATTAAVNIGTITSTGGGGNITFTGSSSSHTSVTLSGTNTFMGNMTITQATVIATSIGAFGSGGASSTIQIGGNSSNAMLTYTGTGGSVPQLISFDDVSTPGLNSSGTGPLVVANTGNAVEAGGTGNTTLTLGGTYVAANMTVDNQFGELITNSGSGLTNLTKTGSGSTVWDVTNPNNSFTGAVNVLVGTLSIDQIADQGTNSELGTGTASGASIFLGSGGSTGTLRYTGSGGSSDRSITLAGAAGGGAINSDGTGALVMTNTSQMQAAAGAKTFFLTGLNTDNNSFAEQVVDSSSGAVSVTKQLGGTWILANTSDTYSGKTTISGGVLGIVGDGSINGGAGGIVFSGGTLQFQNYISNLSFNNTASLSLGAATGAPSTLSGAISGTSSLTYAGPGTLVLGASNNYSGGTSVNAGVLNFISALNLGTGPISFNGGALQYATGNTADVSAISSTPITLNANGGTIDTNGNDVTFADPIGNAGSGGLTKVGSGTLTLSAASNYTGGTNVNGGTLVAGVTGALPVGAVNIANGTLQLGLSTGLATITSLSIAGNGTFDVNNNHVIINYGSGPDPIASIAALLSTGYNGGNWNGPGGIVSTAAQLNNATPGNLEYGIGYADSADTGNPAGLASGTIEVAYTLLGDANLSGVVDGTDFGIVAANFNKGVTGWDQGDFNYDNVVDGTDFGDLAANFNKGASDAAAWQALEAFAAANGLLADVPEPATIGVLAIGACGLMARRRKTSIQA